MTKICLAKRYSCILSISLGTNSVYPFLRIKCRGSFPLLPASGIYATTNFSVLTCEGIYWNINDAEANEAKI